MTAERSTGSGAEAGFDVVVAKRVLMTHCSAIKGRDGPARNTARVLVPGCRTQVGSPASRPGVVLTSTTSRGSPVPPAGPPPGR